ncbi:MAG: poly(3-hydroxybutyrate) depolymerase [Gammaproteobacteria bacterium]|nr:MAG: poly(3-hydroxybutyrate) depolymerase [Gammaproteobacteria bacterium]
MNNTLPYYLMVSFFAVLFIGLPSYGIYFYQTNTYDSNELEMAAYDYPVHSPSPHSTLNPENPGHCQGQVKTALAGHTSNQKTPLGFRFSVKTPSNYQASFPHPLLVVYAPSIGGSLMEKFVGLTRVATQTGYIIAYVDGKSLSLKSIVELGQVPLEIANHWCINPQRIYFTGHSDGGTVSSALVFLEESPVTPRAIAPSAAGINGQEFEKMQCPIPTSIMVMHNKDDSHFPGFGQQAANWWAQCNQCDTTFSPTDTEQCVRYDNCPSNIETLYCEGQGGHIRWPRLNQEMIRFFERNASTDL